MFSPVAWDDRWGHIRGGRGRRDGRGLCLSFMSSVRSWASRCLLYLCVCVCAGHWSGTLRDERGAGGWEEVWGWWHREGEPGHPGEDPQEPAAGPLERKCSLGKVTFLVFGGWWGVKYIHSMIRWRLCSLVWCRSEWCSFWNEMFMKCSGMQTTCLLVDLAVFNLKCVYIYTILPKVLAPPSLEQKNALPNLWQQRWEHNSCIYKLYFISVATVL